LVYNEHLGFDHQTWRHPAGKNEIKPLLVTELCWGTSQNIHTLQLSLPFGAFGSMAGQPPVECETCLPMKQLRDANLVANFVKILLNIIRAAVFFGIFAAPPFPMVCELLPGTDQRTHFSW